MISLLRSQLCKLKSKSSLDKAEFYWSVAFQGSPYRSPTSLYTLLRHMQWAFETVPFNERIKRSLKKPLPQFSRDVGELLMRSSEQLAELCGYRGVATAEFLYEPASGTTTFLEVNSRLQVEHTITEAITGADLVQAQIAIGLDWEWTPPSTLVNGHAIELRVNAEDPEQDFRPAPDTLRSFAPCWSRSSCRQWGYGRL